MLVNFNSIKISVFNFMKNLYPKFNFKTKLIHFKFVIYGIISRCIELIVPLVLTPLILQTYGFEDFNTILYFAVASTFFISLIHFGLESRNLGISKTQKSLNADRQLFYGTFWTQVRLTLLSFIIFCFFLSSLDFPDNNDSLIALFYFLSSVFVASYPSWIIASRGLYSHFLKVVLISRVFYLIVSLGIIYSQKSIVWLALAYFVSSALSYLITILYCHKIGIVNFLPVAINASSRRSYVPYSLINLGGTIFLFCANWIVERELSGIQLTIFLLSVLVLMNVLGMGQTINFSISSFIHSLDKKSSFALRLVTIAGIFFAVGIYLSRRLVSQYLLGAHNDMFEFNLTIISILTPVFFIANYWIYNYFSTAVKRRYLLLPIPVYLISMILIYAIVQNWATVANLFAIFAIIRAIQAILFLCLSFQNYRRLSEKKPFSL